MSLSDRSGHDDQQLVWYLLGLLPEEDAEQLDELSISDDEVAWRLRAVENELVDAYVAGTLTGETLERFESVYLSSERRRQKVKFAGSFLGAVDRQAAPAPADAGARRDVIRPIRQAQDSGSPKAVPSYERVAPRARAAWGLAAAAALLLVACGALLFQEGRLRNGLNEAQTRSAALDRRARELEQQLADQRTANAETARELERVRESMAALAQESAAPRPRDRASVPSLTTALVLLPQTRAVGPIASLTVPEGMDRVTFELRLESNEFPRYEVALKDPATNQIVWRSGRLTSSLTR